MSHSTVTPLLTTSVTENQGVTAQPPWLWELLACPHCGAECLNTTAQCQSCGSAFPTRQGTLDLIRPELKETLADQQQAWQQIEKAFGRYVLPVDRLLSLPHESQSRDLLQWLQNVLARRGRCRVLELGAGRGWAAHALAEDGHYVVATDILDDPQIGLGCAARLRNHTRRHFGCVATAAEQLPFRSAVFDSVFCFATLRHIVDLERVLKEVGRVLRPGGFFVAFQEPFRGLLTSQRQWYQDSFLYRLTRGWLDGKLPENINPELLQMRASLGTTVYDLARRVPYCVMLAQAAGLQTIVLPGVALASLAPDFKSITSKDWLEAFIAAYGLDSEVLRAQVDLVRREQDLDLYPELLAHWTLISNSDGALLAVKDGQLLESLPKYQFHEPDTYRNLDPLLLACAPTGILPVYGLYSPEGDRNDRYYWTEPQAAFLVPGGETVELTVSCPSRRFRTAAVCLEVRIEGDRFPHLVLMIQPEKTATFRVPIRRPLAGLPSLLVRLTANIGFVPSDYSPQIRDTRLLALQLRSVQRSRIAPEMVRRLLMSASG